VTLTLRAFFRQDMIPEGLAMFVAFGSFSKPLGRTALGFHFRHCTTPLFCNCLLNAKKEGVRTPRI